jgi:septal ring factor EnvC (AmiA/AmiB activator)
MKTKMNITLTIVALVIAGLFASCQQGSNIEDRVQNEVSELRDNLNNIAEDDDNFITELSEELEDFESSMNDIREDINESGEQISMSARQAIDDLQGEARSLRMKLESRSGYTDTDRNVTGDNRPLTEDRDAVAGDRTAQMQRDTTDRDTSTLGEGMTGDDDDGPNVMQIDQELRAEFNNFRQNVNQWVDRLSVDTREN